MPVCSAKHTGTSSEDNSETPTTNSTEFDRARMTGLSSVPVVVEHVRVHENPSMNYPRTDWICWEHPRATPIIVLGHQVNTEEACPVCGKPMEQIG